MTKNFLGYKHFKLNKHFIFGPLRQLCSDFTIGEHFPDIGKLRTRYLYLKMAEDSYKNFVCNELIEECNIDKSSLYLQGFEKKYLITMDVEILKRHGLIMPDSNPMCLINGFLNYLEPFPFDSNLVPLVKSQSPSHCMTIKILRDSVEKQYLAWKYNVDLQQINNILLRIHPCLFTCRSLRNLRRNCSILDMVSIFKDESVSWCFDLFASELCISLSSYFLKKSIKNDFFNVLHKQKCYYNQKNFFQLSKKIYLINQLPFNINLILNFNNCHSFLNWDLFSRHGYKTLQCSFSHIYFLIKVLQSKRFTSKQIQEIVPYLYLNFDTFINRMNIILSHPALSKYERHDKFLHLLLYPAVYLMNLNNLNFQSLEELKDAVTMINSKVKLRRRSQRITINSIKYHISNYFAIDNEHLNAIKRHPKYSLVTEEQLSSTLKFLKNSGFSRAEILESIIIILYPRRLIVSALKTMAEEVETLQKLGFVDGYLSEETDFIKTGTKLRRKTLQLCLYYIEKQFNFTWDGVLNLYVNKPDKNTQ